MGLFIDRVTDLYDFVVGRQETVDAGSAQQLFTQSSSTTTAGESIDIDRLLEEPTTLTCINIITQNISQLPVCIKRMNTDGTYELDKEHKVSKLIQKPNHFQSATEFKNTIITSLLTAGNAFIRVIRNNGDPADGTNTSGEIIQLVIMDADNMTISNNSFGYPVYFHDGNDRIEAENMIHIRDLSVFTAQGQSRLLLASNLIGMKLAADRLAANSFRNGIHTNYKITTGHVMKPEEKAEMQAALEAQFGAMGENRGGAILLNNSDMAAIKGLTPADFDLREFRNQLKNEISALLRVPSFMVGGTGNDKFNNVRQRLASFHRDTLNPIIQNIEEALTLRLLPMDNEYVYFDVADLLKGDIETETKLAIDTAGGPIATINEGRKRVGLPVLDGEEYDTIRMASEQEPEDPATGGEDGPRGGPEREAEEQEQTDAE